MPSTSTTSGAASRAASASPSRGSGSETEEELLSEEMEWEQIEASLRRPGRGTKRDNDDVEASTILSNSSLTAQDEEDEEDYRARRARGTQDKGKMPMKQARRKLSHQVEPATKERRTKGKKRPADTSDDHEIGEEWEDLNGLRWRMDADSERRRAAVVVEMRSKYNMPKDSRHPDAKLKVPVLVEKFLSEAEYEEARAQKLLSFQEEERQRDIEEAARKKEEEELRKRSSASGSNRPLATPNKIKRNLDLLFSSPGPLLSPLGSRKRHVSASPLSTSPRQYKKLSLSMGLDSSAEQERESMAPPAAATTPQRPRARSASLSAPQAATTPSKRIPLLSSSTARRSASPSKTYQSIPASPASSPSSPSSPSSTLEAKKRREANLLRLLQLECDRRRRTKV